MDTELSPTVFVLLSSLSLSESKLITFTLLLHNTSIATGVARQNIIRGPAIGN